MRFIIDSHWFGWNEKIDKKKSGLNRDIYHVRTESQWSQPQPSEIIANKIKI